MDLLGVTTNEMRQFYFYGTDDLNFDPLVENVIGYESSYQYESKYGPTCSQYIDVLYCGEKVESIGAVLLILRIGFS